MKNRTADILRRAADHLERVGLNKGAYYKGHESVLDTGMNPETKRRYRHEPCCLFGAVYQASRNENEVDRAMSALRHSAAWRAIQKRNKNSYLQPHVWNDMPSRRKGDVVRLFRKTADEVEAY